MPGMPSCSAIWLALSRPRYDGVPPVSAPAWTLPISGSLARVGVRVAAEVVLLEVVVALGEAEAVAVVVHPVVRDEQVRDREVDVVAARAQLGRVALGVVPGVGERVEVLPRRGERRLRGAARGQRADPGLTVARVVAAAGEGRRLRARGRSPTGGCSGCSSARGAVQPVRRGPSSRPRCSSASSSGDQSSVGLAVK